MPLGDLARRRAAIEERCLTDRQYSGNLLACVRSAARLGGLLRRHGLAADF